jgi:hypothetical protein
MIRRQQRSTGYDLRRIAGRTVNSDRRFHLLVFVAGWFRYTDSRLTQLWLLLHPLVRRVR